MIQRLACLTAQATVDLFAKAGMVLVLVLLSAASGVWAIVAWSELAATLFLSILALALSAAILYVGKRMDVALHTKLDALIAGTDADDAVAGIEKLG